jgi:hypothetical protein
VRYVCACIHKTEARFISLGAATTHEAGAIFIHPGVRDDYRRAHRLMEKEGRVEEEDVAFLSEMQAAPWSEGAVVVLRQRAKNQSGSLDNN